jgi:protein-S-isoprenylcysteine O-methyltransferase Ste14
MARLRATHVFSRVPPPLLFAVTFVAGLLVQRGVWPRLAPMHPGAALHAIGMGLVAVALAIALVSLGLFARQGTTVVPHGQSSRFVTSGFYRISRNPMYLSLALAYLGAALRLEAWLALVLLAAPVAVMGAVVIPMEEAQLRQRFGAEYEAYCRRVRRWL